MARISKRNYYLEIARAVALRSTCLRRQYGAVIVKDDEIVSTRVQRLRPRDVNCCDTGECYRKSRNIPHGEQYEKVRRCPRRAERHHLGKQKRHDGVNAIPVWGVNAESRSSIHVPVKFV